MSFKKTILIDFDGVLHSYIRKWEGAAIVLDPPTAGAINFLRSLLEDDRFDPQVYSFRSREPGGIAAMKAWLLSHGMTREEVDALPFPTEKPAAWLTIDDRALLFTGFFPSLEDIIRFKPWNRK